MENKLKEATAKQAASLSNLLQENSLCWDDLDNPNIKIFVETDDNDDVYGGMAFEKYGTDALFRSVVIRSDYRGQNLGAAIVTNAIALGREMGLKDLYLLTTTAENFFSKFGFVEFPRNEAPDRIGQTEEFRSFCPDSAVCMHLKL